MLLTVQHFITAQSPDMFAASTEAGTVSQSPAEQSTFVFWSILPSVAVCSSHTLTLKSS